jgi:hypothetical protein
MVETYFETILQELLISHVISSFKVLKRIMGYEDGYIRIKCKLSNNDIFEFAEYCQSRKKKIYIETYTFHWQAADGKLIKRWDNVKHHREIKTFPYHLHLSESKVVSSMPMNLEKILKEIEKQINNSADDIDPSWSR